MKTHDVRSKLAHLKKKRRWKDILKLVDKLPVDIRNSTPVRYEICYAQLRLGNVDAPLAELTQLLKKYPTSYLPRYYLGQAYFKKGDYKEAAESYVLAFKMANQAHNCLIDSLISAALSSDEELLAKTIRELSDNISNQVLDVLFKSYRLKYPGAIYKIRDVLKNVNPGNHHLDFLILCFLEKMPFNAFSEILVSDAGRSHRTAFVMRNYIEGYNEKISASYPDRVAHLCKLILEGDSDLVAYAKDMLIGSQNAIANSKAYFQTSQHDGAMNLVKFIEAHLTSRQGFSLIRLGDGEGLFLPSTNEARRQYQNEDRHRMMKVWWGDAYGKNIDALKIDLLELLIEESIKSATVIGFPDLLRILEDHRFSESPVSRGLSAVFSRVNALPSFRYYFTDAFCHIQLLENGGLGAICRAASRIYVITGHESADFDEYFSGIGVNVEKLGQLPLQVINWGESALTHFDDCFCPMIKEIGKKVSAGDLVLVGAGFLGKFYCSEIAKQGGVAVDVGSVFDYLKNKRTRRHQMVDLTSAIHNALSFDSMIKGD